MEYNYYQTPITEELKKDLNPKLYEQLMLNIDRIKFIKNLISKDRKKVTDLERWDVPYSEDKEKDENGKIEVDFSSPHILENMDYFREPAINFKKYGIYTNLRPNRNPNSKYQLWWKEQIRRCREGCVRKDGEWIPGDYYWYLNFSPILKTQIIGKKRADRIEGHPNVYDGDYLFYHYLAAAKENGGHGSVLKSRGKGYSFKAASSLQKILIIGESEIAKNKQKAFVLANEKEYLIKDGTLNKFVAQIDHLAEHTDLPRARIKNSLGGMHWKLGFVDKNTNTEKGMLNEIIGVSLKDDPDKARGKRGSKIWWEEVGKMPGFLTAWQIARPSVEEDGFAFGLMVAFGTGGTENSDFRGLQEVFYRPLGYNVYGIPNVFDINSNPENKCGFFMPAYMNMKGFYDKDGNSDITGGLIQILKERQLIKDNASDPNALTQAKAETPITPQEAIMRKEGSIFPIGEIREYISEIEPNLVKFTDPHYIGNLHSKGKDVIFKQDMDVNIIRKFPLDHTENKEGGIEIFQQPKKIRGEVPWGRYLAGMDTYDDDHSTTNSLGSIFVMDSFTDKIVAEYTGRPRTADEFYNKCLLLLKYFNAICNYENDKKGFFGFIKNRNSLKYLAQTPQILRDIELIKGVSYGNKSYGTPSGERINRWGRRLQADWMLEPVDYIKEDEEEIHTIKLETIRSLPYLQEALQWNIDGNFDRISAMGMLMILRMDRLQYTENLMSQEAEENALDEFWTRPFNKSNRRYREQLRQDVHEQNPITI